MKVLKRLISFILVSVLSFNLIPVTVFAVTYDNSLTFEDYVIEHLKNFETEIDVTEYAVNNGWDEKFLKNEFVRILIDNPQLFYVINSGNSVCTVSKSGKTKNGVVVSINYKIHSFKYSIKKSEYETKKSEFDKAVSKALSFIDDKMTDLEKALTLHEYLILNTVYDQSLSKFTAYDALVKGTAVCQGYSMAYKYLLNRLGIDCTMITSDSMNHAWNYVKIDGKWYHTDVTKDDPLFNNKYDLHGRVTHKFFMVSDAALKKLGHKDWNTEGLPAASSAKYDKFFWKDTETGIFKVGKLWYWIELDENSPAHNNNFKKLSKEEFNNNFYKMYSLIKGYSFDTKKITTIHKFDSTWFNWNKENADNKTWFDGSYSSLAVYDGKLYFNSNKELYSYDLSSKKATVISKPKDLNGYIYGLTMDGKKIIYTVKQEIAANNNLKSKTV